MTERDVNMRATFSEMSYITPDVIPVSPYSLVKRTTNKYDINDLYSIHHCPKTMYPLVANLFLEPNDKSSLCHKQVGSRDSITKNSLQEDDKVMNNQNNFYSFKRIYIYIYNESNHLQSR